MQICLSYSNIKSCALSMTRTELLEIISNGENSGVEFKRDTLQNRDLAKELVAFSNFEGGVVLLGVGDDGSIVGITRPRLEQWVTTVCRDKIRPAIVPSFRVVQDVKQGRDVAVVRVPRGGDVHSLWHNNRNIYYLRVGSQSREPTTQELKRLFQQRDTLASDLRPVSGSTTSDLDIRRIKDYFERVRQQDIPGDEEKAKWKTLLVNTEIMVEGDYEDYVTVSGMLLFGKNPNRFLRQAGIDAVAFPGTEKDYAMKERTSLRGAMTPLFNKAGDMLVEPGLVEQAVYFIRRNTRVIAVLEDGARRVEKWTYPEDAIREAIVNALIHRDYFLGNTDIELAIYSDRLEIISPGRLPNGVTPDRMRTGTRAVRNPILVNIMNHYKYLEHLGMGVPRKIVQGMKEHNGTDPELFEKDERFIVRLFAGELQL